jgi:hypothetical protein
MERMITRVTTDDEEYEIHSLSCKMALISWNQNVSAEQSALIITACRLETLVPQLRLAPVVLEGCRPRVA